MLFLSKHSKCENSLKFLVGVKSFFIYKPHEILVFFFINFSLIQFSEKVCANSAEFISHSIKTVNSN